MSSDKKSNYVVMRRSGQIMTFRDGIGGSPQSGGPYLHILGVIADELQSAGNTYDAPEKLFLDGKLVVERGLKDLAWNYRQDSVGARDAAANEVKNLHMPNWLPADEQKPGYNPPGIDKWTVRKKDKAA